MGAEEEIAIVVDSYFRATRWAAIKNSLILSSGLALSLVIFFLLLFMGMLFYWFWSNNILWFNVSVYALLPGVYIYIYGISGVDPAYKRRRYKIVKVDMHSNCLKLAEITPSLIKNAVMLEINSRGVDRERFKWIVALFISLSGILSAVSDRLLFLFTIFIFIGGVLCMDYHYYYAKNGGKVSVIVSEILEIIKEYKDGKLFIKV